VPSVIKAKLVVEMVVKRFLVKGFKSENTNVIINDCLLCFRFLLPSERKDFYQ